MILLQRYSERMRRAQLSPLKSKRWPAEKRNRNGSVIMGTRTMTAVAQEETDSDDRFKGSQNIIPR